MGEVSLSPRQRAEKLATRTLVEAVGGFEAAALFCRLGKSQLHRCCDLTKADFLPVDVVSVLEETAGVAPITSLHVREGGGVVVRLTTGEVSAGHLCAALADATREHSEITTRLIEALADGNCSPDEARVLIADSTDAIEAGVRLRALLEQIAGEA